MKVLGLLLSLAIVLLGLIGLVVPDRLVAIARYAVTPVGIYFAAILRIGMGVVLAGLAPDSRTPKTLFFLGVIAIIAGVATVFIGSDRAHAVLEWWAARGSLVLRLGAGFAIALGGFIGFAVVTGRRTP